MREQAQSESQSEDGEVQDFTETMARIREQNEQRMQEEVQRRQEEQALADTTSSRAYWILRQVCEDMVRGDENLRATYTSSPNPAVSIAYKTIWMFGVKAKATGERVDVTVNDGKWKQIPGKMTNWGNWLDEESVYHGKVDDKLIRTSIEKAFLDWYSSVSREHPS